MSVQLESQIRDYAREIEASQDRLTVDEIIHKHSPGAQRSPHVEALSGVSRPKLPGAWVAVAAAVVALVLIGGVTLLLRADTGVAPVDQPTTPAITGPTATTTAASQVPTTGIVDGGTLEGGWALVDARFDAPSAPPEFLSVASTPMGLFAVDADAALYRSQDGLDWTPIESDAIQIERPAQNRIGGSGLGLVLVSPNTGGWFSPNGTDWTRLPGRIFPSEFQTSHIAASQQGFLVSVDQSLWFSVDGLDWTEITIESDGALRLAVNSDGFFAAGISAGGAAIWRSADGVTWTPVFEGGGSSFISSIAASDRGIIASTVDDAVLFSPDGETWTRISDIPTGQQRRDRRGSGVLWETAASDDGFLLTGFGGVDGGTSAYPLVWFSDDGLIWAPVPADPPAQGQASGEYQTLWEVVPLRNGFIGVGESEIRNGALVWIYTP